MARTLFCQKHSYTGKPSDGCPFCNREQHEHSWESENEFTHDGNLYVEVNCECGANTVLEFPGGA